MTTFISAADGNEVFQIKFIPTQKPTPALDHPSMLTFISTYPALGQVTHIQKHTTVFTALLEVDPDRASDPWQVSLWHSEGGDWRGVPMDLVIEPDRRPTELQAVTTQPHLGANLAKLYFSTPLAIHLPTNFTIKFRAGPHDSWKWVRDSQGRADGVVVMSTVTSQETISSDLGNYVSGLNPILKSKHHRSQSPGTTLWVVEAPVEGAIGEKSTLKDIRFGLPWGQGKFSRYITFPFWTSPTPYAFRICPPHAPS